MSKFGYEGPDQFRPISAWGYVGYSLLFCIPLIGFIILLVFTFSKGNYNRRSFARSYWCWLLIAILVCVILFGFLAFDIKQLRISESLSQYKQEIENRVAERLTDSNEVITEEKIIEIPEEASEESIEEESEMAGESGVTPSFKAAMDSFESFFVEYIEFMEQYDENTSDLSLISKLASYMGKYTDMLEKMEEMEDDELSDADMAYYLEVTTRIYSKLAKANL